jgi:hypothetical protein
MPTDLTSLIAPERNRYFYGLLMDAERFQKDQDYFNRKRVLLNRFVTGGGVVCGLGLTFTAATGTLTLSPGVAIDLAGREIIVPAATPIDIGRSTDAQGNPSGPVPPGSTIIVSLAYAERKTDAVPVLVPDCDHPNGCAPSTIEEGFAVLVTLATGAPPAIPGCIFGSFPLPPGAALQSDIANRIAGDYGPAPVDASVALGRVTLPGGPLDAISDRPVVYDNTLLYQLIVCLAAQVSQLGGVTLTYVSGDNQSAKAGTALANPLVVALLDAGGNPVTGGSAPQFMVASGGGSVSAVTASGPGQYQTVWTLGSSGAQTVTAQIAQSRLSVTFHATIEP